MKNKQPQKASFLMKKRRYENGMVLAKGENKKENKKRTVLVKQYAHLFQTERISEYQQKK